MSIPSTDGYILTGGAASRMGRDKGALTLAGRTFVDRISNALSGAVRHVFTVGGDLRYPGLQHVNDDIAVSEIDNAWRTSFAGLYTALMHSSADRVIVVACDMPFVASQLFEELVSREGLNAAAIAPESDDGIAQPLCAIYDVGICRPEIRNALDKRELGLRRFLARVNAVIIPFKEISSLSGSDMFFMNVNTPDDLETARRLAGETMLNN